MHRRKMKITNLYLAILIPLLFTTLETLGQKDFEEFKKQTQLQYNTFKQTEDKKFNNYRDSLHREYKLFRDSVTSELAKFRDSLNIEFGNQLKQQWQKKSIKKPLEPGLLEQSPFYYPTDISPAPLQYINNSPENTFYGKALDFTLPKGVAFKLKGVSETDVSEAWLHLNKSDLTTLICDCLLVAQDMNLNTWGYYQMINWLADRIFTKSAKNEKSIFCFFILNQSGYKCKIAATKNGKLNLLLPFNAKIYQKNYLEYDGQLYYIMDDNSENNNELSSYPLTFPGAKKTPDIYMKRPIKLDNPNVVYKEFKLPRTTNVLKVPINKHLIDFYRNYPFCQLDVYVHTPMSIDLNTAISAQLSPLVKNLENSQKVEYLLEFTHEAFRYKPDQEYWKGERYFFPEECFFYPYMDCEDFAILFRNLIRTVVHNDVLLVLYADHVSTAVYLSPDVTAGYIRHHNKKYTLCDPSYIGSKPGQVMPLVNQAQYRIME